MTEKTSTIKTETLVTTTHQTYELLADELIDHFVERAVRGRNSTKKKFKKYDKEDEAWYEKWERVREERAKARQRRPARIQKEIKGIREA